MDIEIKKVAPDEIDDFSELIHVFESAFEMENFKIPDRNYLSNLLNKDDFMAIAVKFKNKVIGGLTVYILHPYYSSKPIAYIYDVAILDAYQRNGIGKKLIAFLIEYCKEHGFEDAYVQAETNDNNAVRFYQQTSISIELQAIQFTYSFTESTPNNNQ